jgi:hypothetical protein
MGTSDGSDSRRHNRRPKLVLHIGPHKTGTTALQSILASNTEILKGFGWSYVDQFEGGLTTHALADCLSTGRIDRARTALEEISQLSENTIISSENFSRLSGDQIIILAESAARLDTRIVYYIRNPMCRLFSAWQEWVKHGYLYTFPEYLSARLANFTSDPEVNDVVRIRRWFKGLPRAEYSVFNYDAISDVPADFFDRVLDCKFDQGKVEGRANSSSSISMTECIRASLGAYRNLVRNADSATRFWQEFGFIENEIKALSASGNHVHTLSASADEGAFAFLEDEIAKTFPGLERKGDHIFVTRKMEWKYINPNIWIDQIQLTQRMFEFRRDLTETYGPPLVDVRLKAV